MEFQADLSEDDIPRMHEYATRIYREFGLPVKTVIVFLETTAKIEELVPIHQQKIGDEVLNEFRYNKVVIPKKNWKSLLALGLPALFPLIVLAHILKEEEEEAIKEATKQIENIADQKTRREIAAVFYLLSGYNYREEIKKIIGEKIMKELMESATYREAVEKGKIEGKIEGLKEMLSDAIGEKFGEVPKNLQNQIDGISNEKELHRLFKVALKATSLNEIEQQFKK